MVSTAKKKNKKKILDLEMLIGVPKSHGLWVAKGLDGEDQRRVLFLFLNMMKFPTVPVFSLEP